MWGHALFQRASLQPCHLAGDGAATSCSPSRPSGIDQADRTDRT